MNLVYKPRTILFVVLLIAVSAVLHAPAYLLYSVETGFAVIPLGIFAAVMAIGLILLLGIGHRSHFDVAAVVGDTWLGIVWQLFVWSVAGQFVRGVAGIAGAPPVITDRVIPLLFLAITLVLLGYGAVSALGRVRVKHVDVAIDGLPPELDGLRIGQLTDTHLSTYLGAAWMRRIVDQLNAEDPDIVCHTGDLADGDVTRRTPAVRELGRVAAPLGRYFITGNHEYFSDAAHWVRVFREMGWDVLLNEHRLIPGGLAVAGINDPAAPGNNDVSQRPNAEAAVAGIPAGTPIVFLAHEPKQFPDAVRVGAALQLSGHTHGGQMWPFHYLVKLDQKYVAGLIRSGNTQLYTSRGTGFWGPPFRIFAPPEITVLSLHPA